MRSASHRRTINASQHVRPSHPLASHHIKCSLFIMVLGHREPSTITSARNLSSRLPRRRLRCNLERVVRLVHSARTTVQRAT